MRIAVHYNPSIKWQAQRAPQFLAGLKTLGFEAHLTTNRQRESDIAVLLGTTYFRAVEATGRYLLVDRASFGDPHYVQLVWDGHGRRGNHCVPDEHDVRPIEVDVHKWEKNGSRIIVCGQTETYSPEYRCLEDWYDEVSPFATHFRHHPAGGNPTGLPLAQDWTDCRLAICLNSSVAVEAVLGGIPTVTMDEHSLAWDVTSHDPGVSLTPDRRDWLHWLTWTQWRWDEIEQGEPIRHLFEVV